MAGSINPRSFLLALVLLTVSASLVAAQRRPKSDCEICQKKAGGGQDCSFYYYEGTPNDCKTAPAALSCKKCPPDAGKDKDVNCACIMDCVLDGGASLWQCKCPDKAKGTMCSDPHFRGAFGIEYDFHGLPDKDFCLVSDKDLNVNAHFIGQDGVETGFDGTWMSALGIKWNEGFNTRHLTVTVKQSADIYAEDFPFTFNLNGKELSPGTNPRTLYEDTWLTISRYSDARSYFIDVQDHINLTVAAVAHEFPHGNHIDIRIEKLYVTGTVHGALGQTFADSHREALRAAAADVGTAERFDAADIIEGKDLDYMTSDLLATDAHFNRYVPAEQSFVNVLKMNVMRRLLNDREGIHTPAVEEVQFVCESTEGRLTCFM